MQAVILAGGFGTRLGEITQGIPKPMVRINGKPFLEYVINYLLSNNIKNILLLVSYLREQIIDYFDDGSKFGVKINYSIETEALGTGGALKLAEKLVDDECILINGDTFLQFNLSKLISNFQANKDKIKALIVAYDNKDLSLNNNLCVNNQNVVLAYNKDDYKSMTHVDAGFIVLKKEILDMINTGMKVSLEKIIFPQLIARKELKAYPISKKFIDMGTKQGICEMEKILK